MYDDEQQLMLYHIKMCFVVNRGPLALCVINDFPESCNVQYIAVYFCTIIVSMNFTIPNLSAENKKVSCMALPVKL